MVVVEIDKVAEAYNGGVTEEVLADELTAWLYVLARGYRDEEEVDEIMEHFPDIEEFAEQYGLAINDPDTKRAYESYWLDVMEYNSMIDFDTKEARKKARAEGLAEGRAEGRAEGLAEGRAEMRDETLDAVSASMRSLGVSEETIAKVLERSRASVAVESTPVMGATLVPDLT